MCILFDICEKNPFQKCMGQGGGRGSHFSLQHNTLDGAGKHGTALLYHFSGRAGTPLRETSPCLWTGTFLQFFQILQPPCLHWHPPFVKRRSPQAMGCEVHISLFGQPDLAPGNSLTVS